MQYIIHYCQHKNYKLYLFDYLNLKLQLFHNYQFYLLLFVFYLLNKLYNFHLYEYLYQELYLHIVLMK